MSDPNRDPAAFRTTPLDPVKGDVPKNSEVSKFHTNADTDGNPGSIHHTLGPKSSQASPGDHDHRGGTSVQLLQGHTLTGSRGSNAALTSLITLLVNEFGLTDNTTP